MNLSYAYQKLFTSPGYSFIYAPDGECYEWGSYYMYNKGLVKNRPVKLHLVPGSFNPLHETHKEIFHSIENEQGKYCFFEISVERVDKEMVTLPELSKRLEQFEGYAPVVVSRAPRFVTKIGTYVSHVKHITFHVGIDTITRMADDYGVFGIQGLYANFIVHDRIMNGKRMSLNTEFGRNVPMNCTPGKAERTEDSLKRSSTNIRNAK